MEEENFPRGGTSTPQAPQKRHAKFDDDENHGAAKKKSRKAKMTRDEKKEMKAKARKKESKLTAKAVLDTAINSISILRVNTLNIDMLVLGIVKSVGDFSLLVSLPGGLEGVVNITQICQSYTDMLQRLTQGELDSSEAVASLSDLFQVGMCVRCKVLTSAIGDSGKRRVQLSINPKDVNQHISAKHLKTGMVVAGCVSSCEDHGFIIDLGIAGIKSFLKKKAALKFCEEYREGNLELQVGSYLHVMIAESNYFDSGESRTVKVEVNLRKVHRSLANEQMKLSLTGLLPGTPVTATVVRTSGEGINVQFLTYTGFIHHTHLEMDLQEYTKGQEIHAVVLYVHPTSKAVALSTLTHMITPDIAPRLPFGDLQRGNIIEDANVIKVDQVRGIYLSLNGKHKAFASKANLSDKEITNISTSYAVDSKYNCRILGFNYAENTVAVTLKESVLAQQYMKYDDLIAGTTIDGTVKTLTKEGMVVSITKQLHGFVPRIHLADVMLKHPEKKYSPGTKVKCKVLTIQPKLKRLLLSCKKSLVRSKNPSLTSFEQAEVGMTYDGVIVKIQQQGCLVTFYNDVKGWVPPNQLSTEKIPFPEKAFYVGQVVRCRILNCDPFRRRMTLSFRDAGKTPAGSKMAVLPPDFEIGGRVDCKVENIAQAGLDVKILPSGIDAFLPTEHLSDNASLRLMLKNSYRQDDVIKEVMYLEASSVIKLTMKPSLVEAAKQEITFKDFDSLSLGKTIPGTICRIMEYGVFVDLTHKLVGLAPNKFLYDQRISGDKCLYQLGQSVVAKVTEIDVERKRFLLSLRMRDCYHGELSSSLQLLKSYMSDYEKILSNYERLSNFRIGSLVTVQVTEVTEHGVTCMLEGGIVGFATNEHLAGKILKVDSQVECVVLYVDPMAFKVQVAFKTNLVEAVKGRINNKYSKVETGQKLKCEVLLCHTNFILVHLLAHGKGKMAFLPAKKHLNDVLETKSNQYHVGQEHPIVIKLVDDKLTFAILKSQDDLKTQDAAEDGTVKLGNMTTASITHILEHYLIVNIGGTPGRVHVSELTDSVSDATNPLHAFTLNQQVKIKVIGVHNIGKSESVPLKELGHCRRYVDCTMRASRLGHKGFSRHDDPARRQYKRGQSVNVFVEKYVHPCLHVMVSAVKRANIYLTNLSDDLEVLKSPESHFLPGQSYLAHVLLSKGNTLELTLSSLTQDVSSGSVLPGVVADVQPGFLIVNLARGYRGNVVLTDISDDYEDMPTSNFKKNQLVQCCVIDCSDKRKCALSLRPSRVNKSAANTDKEVAWEDIVPGINIQAYITGSSAKGIFVSVARNISCRMLVSNVSQYFIREVRDVFYVGKLVTARVLSVDPSAKTLELSLREDVTGVTENIPSELLGPLRDPDAPKKPRQEKQQNGDNVVVSKDENIEKVKKSKKRKISVNVDAVVKKVKAEDDDSGVESENEVIVKKDKPASSAVPHLSLSSEFSWDANQLPQEKIEVDHSDTSDEEDEVEIEAPKNNKPKSRAEKVQEKKDEEKRVFKREQELLDSTRSPECVDDFDRLMLQSPDSSIVWLRYMAFHLETAEIEKARGVAERALKTISFREEQEKLNVWVAYLNLENMYGTPQLLEELFQRALERNDPCKVYYQLISIYDQSEKLESAGQLYEKLIRRFSLRPDVWINYGLFHHRHGKSDMARGIMQKSLKSLDLKKHVEVIVKFAQMEFKHAEPERGKTMFESVLSNYPKRNDLWLVYIDMVTNLAEYDNVRKLFERAVSVTFSAKKMKSIFKKYLDFESKYGNDDTVAAVKQKAMEFVTSRTGAE